MPQTINVLFLAAEAEPFVKVGGLGDVAGTLPREELAGAIKTHTRQFAKRQGTWFRSLEECSPIPMTEPVDSVLVAQRIYTRLAGG